MSVINPSALRDQVRAARDLPTRLSRAAMRRAYQQAGLTPIEVIDKADIIIDGYPKSGHTWMQVLAAGVLFGLMPKYAPDTLIQDLIPDQQFRTLYRRYRTPTIFKSHHLPRAEYRRVVYLLRDGRDVLVSYLHHKAALAGKEFTALATTALAGEIAAEWCEHVNAWSANPFEADVLLLRYENLLEDTPRELSRFCEFAAFRRDPSELQEVTAGATFARMQQREAADGWDHPSWPKDRPFVRRGVSGSFRDELPGLVLEAFIERAGPTLARLGYTL